MNDNIVKARIAQSTQVLADRAQRLADWEAYGVKKLKIMAHGDSWFDYPRILMTNGGVPDHLSKLLGVPILNMAHAGDTTETMLSIKKRKELESHLPGKDILLFSGGGDDIAGDQFCVWLNDNKGGGVNGAINQRRLNSVLDMVESTYLDLIEIRDELAPNCLIVTHSYDFAIPSDKGVCGLGPWLKPSLEYCGWTDPIQQQAITQNVLMQFQDLLAKIAEDEADLGHPHLHVNTQGTLAPGDWENEIHPNNVGFEKIALKIKAALEASPFISI